MFYPFVKIAVRLALKIFCRSITIENKRSLAERGPLLLVANHPNSFLDAIIIAAHCKYPIHFLARGDAFHKPWHNTLLRLLNMIPVYRLSEGKEYLALNEWAFRQSKAVLQKGGIVLIFIEGICLHQHKLQPFKKGAARIAMECSFLSGFRVMPVALAYHSFTDFGKVVNLSAGEPEPVQNLLPFEEEAKNLRYFNERQYELIRQLIRIPPATTGETNMNKYPEWMAALPGYFLHAPFYYFLSRYIQKKTAGTVFYDSVLFGALLFLYPVYLLLLALILFALRVPVYLVGGIILFHPPGAWLTVQYWRRQ